MFGDFYLRFAEDALEMTDTERRSCKKVENAQPRAIAQTLIDPDQVHGPVNNTPPMWRNSRLLFRPHDARAPDIACGRAARSDSGGRHPV
jgi:hypothetical protein